MVLLLIAFGFHRTALIIGLALLTLMWGFQNNKILFTKIVSVIVCIFPFLFRLFPGLILGLNYLPTKYHLYFNRLNIGQSSVFLDAIMYFLPTLIFVIIYFRKKRTEKHNLLFFMVAGITSISCSLASNLLVSRLSYYFIIFFCYSVPYTSRIINKKNHGRLIYLTAMTLWFGVMWYVNIVFFGYGDTYPYILGKF